MVNDCFSIDSDVNSQGKPEAFYVVCRDESITQENFTVKDRRWTGATFAIYEPVLVFYIGTTPVVESRQMFVPLETYQVGADDAERVEQAFAEEWAVAGGSLEIIVKKGCNLRLEQLNVVDACGTRFCDSQHDAGVKCGALTAGSPQRLILECSVNSREAGVTNVMFKSYEFSRLFMTDEVMEVSDASIGDILRSWRRRRTHSLLGRHYGLLARVIVSYYEVILIL